MTDSHLLERRAQALVEMQNTLQDLHEQRTKVSDLERERDRLEDRITLLVDERNRFRTDAKLYQRKLTELATSMANIGLLTRTAEEIMMSVRELEASGETEEEAAAEKMSASEMIRKLPVTLDSPRRNIKLSEVTNQVEAALAS